MSDTPSPAAIDLHDIQGNIIKGYGRFGYPHARYLFLSVRKEADARRFLRQIINNVTTSVPWGQPGPNQEPVPKPLPPPTLVLLITG